MLQSAAHAHDANYMMNRKTVLSMHRGIAAAVVGLVIETGALAVNLVL